MKRFIFPILSLSLLIAVLSCKKEESGKIIMSIEKTEFSLPEKGGEVEVSFVPLTAWEALCSDSFVTIDPSKGEASAEEIKMRVKVEANNIPYPREITVNVNFAFNTVDIHIVQEPMSPPTPPDSEPTPIEGILETEDIIVGDPIE